MPLFIGCPVWSFKGWVGNFYPMGTKPTDYLREYSRRLTTIEGNTTFYALPESKTIASWVNDTPDRFQFCPKLPKAISHAGKLSENIKKAREFVHRMQELGSRLGPMFLQLSPAFSPDFFEELVGFLEAWPVDVRLAVEIRHADWFQSINHTKLTRTLEQLGMTQVILDTRPIRTLAPRLFPGSDAYDFLLNDLSAVERSTDLTTLKKSFTFLRFVGHPRRQFNSTFLEAWIDRLTPRLAGGEDVYVFCHCPDPRFAPFISRLFYRMAAGRIPLPALPWDDLETSTYQQGELL